MPTIEIRDVPEDLQRALTVRAAAAGMSLSDYLRREIEALAVKPTLRDVLERIAGHEPVDLPESSRVLVAHDRR